MVAGCSVVVAGCSVVVAGGVVVVAGASVVAAGGSVVAAGASVVVAGGSVVVAGAFVVVAGCSVVAGGVVVTVATFGENNPPAHAAIAKMTITTTAMAMFLVFVESAEFVLAMIISLKTAILLDGCRHKHHLVIISSRTSGRVEICLSSANMLNLTIRSLRKALKIRYRQRDLSV